MNKTSYEKGYEKGLEIAMDEGRRTILRMQLEERFGPLPATAAERLQHLPGASLSALARAVLHAQSLRELGLED